jgi:hypothetical protein
MLTRSLQTRLRILTPPIAWHQDATPCPERTESRSRYTGGRRSRHAARRESSLPCPPHSGQRLALPVPGRALAS